MRTHSHDCFCYAGSLLVTCYCSNSNAEFWWFIFVSFLRYWMKTWGSCEMGCMQACVTSPQWHNVLIGIYIVQPILIPHVHVYYLSYDMLCTMFSDLWKVKLTGLFQDWQNSPKVPLDNLIQSSVKWQPTHGHLANIWFNHSLSC